MTSTKRVSRRLAVQVAALVFVVSAASLASGQQSAGNSDLQHELVDILERQAEAWSKGDLELFMQGYWRSEELTFSSGGNTTRGWQATLDRYRQRYRNQAEMGHLKFSDLEVTPLGGDAALMLGRYYLTAQGKEFGGNFSLVWRKLGKQWLIIHDHSSETESESETKSKADNSRQCP